MAYPSCDFTKTKFINEVKNYSKMADSLSENISRSKTHTKIL